MKKHVNVPIFIPHYGCPNDCVFCNQRKITVKPCYDKNVVIAEIEQALSTIESERSEVELAFFGGSFTAIPENEMLGLLEVSDIFLSEKRIDSVRLSTRPDAINGHILQNLASHGVKTIELGLQSFSDTVLSASKRGHTASQSEQACKLIKDYGFQLIGQMMVGLPCSTLKDELDTAEKICELGCDGARIYPTVVFPDTELDKMTKSGAYTPLTTEQAIERSAKALEVFIRHRVPVIRIGLCSNETLSDENYAENYHPSVGELSINRYYLDKMKALLSAIGDTNGKNAVFIVAKGKISQAVGQKRANVLALIDDFGLKDVKIKESDDVRAFELSLDIR